MCEDNFYDEDFDEPEIEDNSLNENLELGDMSPQEPFTLEEFTFWGGFLGINIDEERKDKKRKKKKEQENPDFGHNINGDNDF